MKVWSDTLILADIYAAAHKAGADVEEFDQVKARKRAVRFDVHLSGNSPHSVNSGTHGGAYYKAASWDQWGIFLAELFERDPNMTTAYYSAEWAFHAVTAERFKTLTFEQSHRRHNWSYDPALGEHVCACGARTVFSEARL